MQSKISAINEGAGKITVQVPPYTYAPFYNVAGGAVNDISTNARHFLNNY